MKWLSISWWKFLLEKPLTLTKFKCRVTQHKCGPIYYNVNGLEPNWKCKNCGDYLG